MLMYDQNMGHTLDIATDRGWYVTLGMTLGEFANAPASVLRLRSLSDGVACRASIVHYASEKRLLIGDIEAYVENKGYGTIMLENIIKLARQVDVREIRGNLSEVDSDHFDKLEYFYGKHGFTTRFNKLRTNGTVRLKLYAS